MIVLDEPAPLSDTEYAELLEGLRELHQLKPTLRFGQMICNLAMLAGRDKAGDVWEIEDHELIAALQNHITRLKSQCEPVTA